MTNFCKSILLEANAGTLQGLRNNPKPRKETIRGCNGEKILIVDGQVWSVDGILVHEDNQSFMSDYGDL